MWRILLCLFLPSAAWASPFSGVDADVFVLGEVHDNAAHHAAQAEAIADITPTAVVFEMLTPAQAGRLDGGRPDTADALAALLEWEEAGWPDFDMYYPIFTAANEARIVGAAVPRDETRNAIKIGVARAFGQQAEAYGLTAELPTEELADRLNLQMDAHCGALPVELLPGMVDLQRLRDATLARAALTALDETGGPVAVITGNGHARADWGVPSYIARVRPEVTVATLGQGEGGDTPDGGFDVVLDAAPAEREDPCAAFR